MTNETLIKKSKWLSRHLCHAPQRVELELETGGWVEVEKLLEAAKRNGMALCKPLVFVVAAAWMHAEGFAFFCSENGVWFVDAVAPQYLSPHE